MILVLVLSIGTALGLYLGKVHLPGQVLTQSSPYPLPKVVQPTSQAPAPAPSPPPQDPVGLGVPTSIVVHRGQATVIVPSRVDGAYIPTGMVVDPPGDNPVWIGTSSNVGTGMKTAVIAGHAEEGHSEMPFTSLGLVQPGDTVDVTVPEGTLTFAVDSADTPDRSTTGFPALDNTLKLISCSVAGGGPITKNVIVSAHLVSSKAN